MRFIVSDKISGKASRVSILNTGEVVRTQWDRHLLAFEVSILASVDAEIPEDSTFYDDPGPARFTHRAYLRRLRVSC